MNSNLKWLLLIPVLAIAIALGYLIPTQLMKGDDNGDDASNQQQNQAAQIEIADVQTRIDDYTQVLARQPDDPDVLRVLADTYYQLGTIQSGSGQVNESYRSQKAAVDNYRKYLAVRPNDAEVMIDLGLSYAELQMIDIAIRELNNAVTLAPTNQRAWHSLGWVHYQWGNNLTDAKVAWQKSYDLNPNSPIGQESKQFLDQFAGQQGGLVLPSTP